jgi:hypothetical protein
MNFMRNDSLISEIQHKYLGAANSKIQGVDEIHIKLRISLVKINYLV